MKNVLDEIKELDILVAKRLFMISKIDKTKTPPSPKQFKIIKYLLDHKDSEVYQKDLEKNFSISKATISETLLTMERKNIIKRIPNETDQRKKQIVLSDNSLENYMKMQKDINILNMELISNIEESEIESFFITLDKLKNNIKNKLNKED